MNIKINPKQKTYFGVSRDHSGSMSHLRVPATKDYNTLIRDIRDASNKEGIDTVVSVIKCGSGYDARNIWETQNSSVNAIRELEHQNYDTEGSYTPLFDSVGDLILQFEKLPDVNDSNVSFLIMVVTDGENNRTLYWPAHRLQKKIEELQATDRWTFVFRVPRGKKYALMNLLGIPEGNILEWDLNTKGVEVASQITQSSTQAYYSARKSGVRATKSFFSADLSAINPKNVQTMEDISKEVEVWENIRADMRIDNFCNSKLKKGSYTRGCAFYELMKHEKAVQDYKVILIRETTTGKIFFGSSARFILGIPTVGTISLKPEGSGKYEIYIQSTSDNRTTPKDTRVIYWENVRH